MLPDRVLILDQTIKLVMDNYEVLANTGSNTRHTRGYCYTSPWDTEDKELVNEDGLVRQEYSYTVTNERSGDDLDEVFDYQLCAPAVKGSPLKSVLGHGCYSVVLECRDPQVAVKVGMGHEGDGNIWSDGWLDYAVFCMKNPGMFGTPKIHGIQAFDDEGFYVAMIDKYQRTVGDMDYDYSDYERHSAQCKMKAMTHGLRPSWGFNEKFAREYPQYCEAGKIINKRLRDYGINDSYDLHDWNFMLDNRNRVILTDPSASSCTLHTKDYLTKVMKEAA